MDQNFIINFANELIGNLYSDISNTRGENNIARQLNDISSSSAWASASSSSSSSASASASALFRPYVFRPISINYIDTDTSAPNNLQTIYNNRHRTNNTLYDSSYITIESINNYTSNYPRAISLRDLLRTLYLTYDEEYNNTTSLESFINSTFENRTKIKKVISTSELEKLKPQKFIKINETETNNQCPILCYNFEENEEIIKLPCNHNYNCEAIIKWLSEESNTCPVCRHEFDYKEINSDNKRQNTQDESNTENTENTQDESNTENTENTQDESNTENTESTENTNIYNLFSNEEILMQQILFNSYSNNNHSNNSY
jgi:hypothetical protein